MNDQTFWHPRDIWCWLVEPNASVEDIALRRQARLLSVFLIILFTLFVLQNAVGVIALPGYSISPVVAGGYLIFAVAYGVNRAGLYKLAAALTVADFPFVTFGMVITATSTDASVTLAFLVISSMLAAILLPPRGMVILTIVNTAGMLLLPVLPLEAGPEFSVILFPLGLNFIVAALALVSMHHRELLEQDRQAELRQAAEALQKANDELEIRVAQRTAELTDANATLATQARELARSNKELEYFAYVASHDLQEPLRMVTSYLQLLERRYKGQLDEAADDFIAFAVDGASRMRTLINDLLTYSRVSTHGKPLEPTDGSVVLGHALANLKIAIEESEAVVTHDEMPTVMADGVQLTQVFQNLIGNALKFHQQGTRPEIHVGAERQDGEWVLSVRDNGIGIEPEHFQRIFMIFQRLHDRTEYEGTGIGLAVCKKTVERHGGRIWVESEPGKGSTFYFTIPDKEDNSS